MRRTADKQKTARHRGAGQLRIIGGQLRGRKLAIADLPGLRPTTDRVRETVFNWLQFELAEQRCLDVFAGTGALGLEALSRGAAEVVMLERNKVAAELLQHHAMTLNPVCHGQAQVQHTDALKWLQQSNPRPFNVVFVDPPFRSNLAGPACALLARNGWLADDALVYLETEKEWPLEVPANWQLQREKIAGQVAFRLFAVRAQGANT
jgi:16S rRNA (guanine966-N2)-methyltransferase